VVQKIGAQYLAKKIADQMLNPTPAAPPAPVEQGYAPQTATTASNSPRSQGSDMLVVNDENGHSIGAAYRVSDVAVYIVTNPQFDRAQELQRSVGDADTQVYFHHENGRLAGIIYAPAKSQTLGDLHGGRADDV
jgi:hypothetical protein